MEIKMETRLSTGMGLTISRAPCGAAGALRGRLLSASPGILQQHLPGHPEWGMLGMGSGSGRPQTGAGSGERGAAAPGGAWCGGPRSWHSPHLERLKGREAQPDAAFLSRPPATQLRSREGCSRRRGCPLVGFIIDRKLKGGGKRG